MEGQDARERDTASGIHVARKKLYAHQWRHTSLTMQICDQRPFTIDLHMYMYVVRKPWIQTIMQWIALRLCSDNPCPKPKPTWCETKARESGIRLLLLLLLKLYSNCETGTKVHVVGNRMMSKMAWQC